jgi:hypothetical protein
MGKKEKRLLRFLIPPIPIPTPSGDILLVRPGSKTKRIRLPKPRIIVPRHKVIVRKPRPITRPRTLPVIVRRPHHHRHCRHYGVTYHTTVHHTCRCTVNTPPPPPPKPRVVRYPTVIVDPETETHSIHEGGYIDENGTPAPTYVECPRKPERVIIVRECPPAPVREYRPHCSAPNFVWVRGHWTYRKGTWCWISGAWRKPPNRHCIWKPGKWVAVGNAWQWRSGRWYTCKS